MKQTQLINWLYSVGRFNTDFASFIKAFCNQLVALGIANKRVRINFRTLHPQVIAWSCTWDRVEGVRVDEIPKDIVETDDYIGSPIQYIYENEQPFRCRLTKLTSEDHAVLHDLSKLGLTDYYACPIRFSNNAINTAIFATDDPQGYTQQCIEFLDEIALLVTPFVETLATRRLARNLLETYIGPRTGRRILEGQIERGDGEEIKAAIWFSDFRNFTQYTETMSLEQMLETLNEYFEIVHQHVEANGGEILRFIGDAMLIVFPVEEDRSLAQACQSALTAALAAQQQAKQVNQKRDSVNKPKIEFGVGLHEGCVMYGNVGAPTRLDFTVMGVAVNRTARLESLTKELGRSVLVSAEFNQQINDIGQFEGEFPVKGVSKLLQAFSVNIS